MQVKVLCESFPSELEKKINALFEEGYRLYGNVTITNLGHYTQMMLKG